MTKLLIIAGIAFLIMGASLLIISAIGWITYVSASYPKGCQGCTGSTPWQTYTGMVTGIGSFFAVVGGLVMFTERRHIGKYREAAENR